MLLISTLGYDAVGCTLQIKLRACRPFVALQLWPHPGHEDAVLIRYRAFVRYVCYCQMEMYTKENERLTKTLQLEVRKEAAVSQSLSVASFSPHALFPSGPSCSGRVVYVFESGRDITWPRYHVSVRAEGWFVWI